jgi:hypothetical protein
MSLGYEPYDARLWRPGQSLAGAVTSQSRCAQPPQALCVSPVSGCPAASGLQKWFTDLAAARVADSPTAIRALGGMILRDARRMTSWQSLLYCAAADVTLDRIENLVALTGTEPLTVDFKGRREDCDDR